MGRMEDFLNHLRLVQSVISILRVDIAVEPRATINESATVVQPATATATTKYNRSDSNQDSVPSCNHTI